MADIPRLIEHAFPLKQASLDSVHEKNVRHGHISTLHIWPARRPLAACRAALIATLLPDPSAQPKPEGMSEDGWQQEILRRRQELCEKIGGKVVKKIERKKMPNGQTVEREKEITEGGILHWGRETENKELLNWFRQEIRKAYDGKAPKVLDPFAGGGAIPLEAMRLGCEATAIDINPVAWFILKCTLEYPQKLAGKKHPLPDFILENEEFMEAFYKAHYGTSGTGVSAGRRKKKNGTGNHLSQGRLFDKTGDMTGRDACPTNIEADLAWHVRAWGRWILDQARRDLAKYYPTYADFELPASLRSAQPGPLGRLPISRERNVFYCYVLRCANGSFYIGQTDNLYRRYMEHVEGQVSWTSKYLPVELVHWEEFKTRPEALKREEELKTGFGRKWIQREYAKKGLRVQLYLEPRLVPQREDGTPDIERLNKEFVDPFAARHEWGRPISHPSPREKDGQNGPACATEKSEVAGRWIAKPTVAYFWARTVQCKNCRAVIPLLKTRWLCKKEKKRVLLTLEVKYEPQSMVGQGVGQASLPVVESASYPAQKGEILIYKRQLPHWRMPGAVYFVTWRLNKLQSGLQPEERDLIASALRHFDGERYALHGYVIMDDHVHVIVQPLEGQELRNLNHSWKSYTANQFQRQFNRHGSVWQDESWDRIIRDEEEYWEKMQYIQNNPQKRWPETVDYSWVAFPKWEKEGGDGQAGTPVQEPTRGDRQDKSTTGGTGVPACHLTESCPSNPYIVFAIEQNVPVKGGNPAQRRENDKRLGEGTMSRSGAKCPCCGTIMTMEDIRLEGKAGRLGAVNTAVVVDGEEGKEYRLPTPHELEWVGQASPPVRRSQGVGQASLPGAFLPGTFLPGKETGTEACPTIEEEIQKVFAEVPFGVPEEPLPSKEALGFRVPLYGFDQWNKLFAPRQILALGTFVKWTRGAKVQSASMYDPIFAGAIALYLTSAISRTSDYMGRLCVWENGAEEVKHVFMRWALPMTWDMAEGNPLAPIERFYAGGLNSIVDAILRLHKCSWTETLSPTVINLSALAQPMTGIDVVVTDPPYYDAIPYADLMDFFYVWLRRTMNGFSAELDLAFTQPLSPKWDHDKGDGELIDDSSRHGGDRAKSKAVYEDGMLRSFISCYNALKNDGRLVIVFAHKQPDAWETLVSAMIRAGFVVDGSWPIQTEMRGGIRNLGRASLSSSVWLVCKKRPATARPGWDNQVLEEMRQNIRERLREYWDAGIRGPDFVWAATGPALEAYSKHPVVKKANEPGTMTVSEFLTHVRRMVVDFVVGRVLSTGETHPHPDPLPEGEGEESNLDPVTAYYLLHRHDFGLEEAPAGACILYAISCGVSDKELADTWNLIGFTKGKAAEEVEDDEADADAGSDPDVETESGSKVKLKTWVQRRGSSLGYDAPGGKPVPLIDRVHCLMHFWKGGDVHKVDEYLDGNGLRRQELFKRLLQSLIELSPHASEERALLESISNHVQAKGMKLQEPQLRFQYNGRGEP